MKFLNQILPCLLLIAACSRPAPKPAHQDAKNSIRLLLDQQVSAWNSGSIDGFMQGYWQSDSLRFIGKRGIRHGYDSVAANYKRHYNSAEKMGRLSFSELSFLPLASEPPLYNVCGKWRISGSDSAGGFFSLLVERKKEGFRITADHTW
jgi:hypothetical protein